MVYLIVAVVAAVALYLDSKRANPLVWGKIKALFGKTE